jgi:putative endonuclease
LANRRNGAIYVGVTGNLQNRISIHKTNIVEGFTKRYEVHILVYFEEYDSINDAIAREKQLKNWERKWKLELIEKMNPEWEDLSEDL